MIRTDMLVKAINMKYKNKILISKEHEDVVNNAIYAYIKAAQVPKTAIIIIATDKNDLDQIDINISKMGKDDVVMVDRIITGSKCITYYFNNDSVITLMTYSSNKLIGRRADHLIIRANNNTKLKDILIDSIPTILYSNDSTITISTTLHTDIDNTLIGDYKKIKIM